MELLSRPATLGWEGNAPEDLKYIPEHLVVALIEHHSPKLATMAWRRITLHTCQDRTELRHVDARLKFQPRPGLHRRLWHKH